MVIDRFESGKIKDSRIIMDTLGLMARPKAGLDDPRLAEAPPDQLLRSFEGRWDSMYEIVAALSANSSTETTNRLLVPASVKDRGDLVT
jgi:hypothetical protein